jgi:Tfp pilus assembly protein PilX
MIKYFRHRREEGSAMIIALLMMLMLLSIVATMTTMAMTGLSKGKATQDFTALSNAADSAVNNAIALSNNPSTGQSISAHVGPANAVYGAVDADVTNPSGDGKYLWRWYVQAVPTRFSGLSYDLYATGYKNDPNEASARRIRVRLESLAVYSASYGALGTKYQATQEGMFAWGALGLSSVELKGSASIYSFDSRAVLIPASSSDNTHNGRFATNGKLTYTTTSAWDQMAFLQSSPQNPVDSTRCIGTRCDAAHENQYSYGIDLSHIQTVSQSKCPNATYPDWVASQQGNMVNPLSQGQCFGNIIFDQNTTLSGNYSSGNPAVMYAKGNVTVKAGVDVNIANVSGQGPLSLRIYSQSGSTLNVEHGITTDPTRFMGMIGGAGLTCDIGSSSAFTGTPLTKFYGSIACNTITIEDATELWWDEQTIQVLGGGSPDATFVWSATTYEEL